jgi:hypothetical protein
MALEGRTLLSAWTVNSTADSTDANGDPTIGTLRWAIELAAFSNGADTTDFDPTVFATPQTITRDPRRARTDRPGGDHDACGTSNFSQY